MDNKTARTPNEVRIIKKVPGLPWKIGSLVCPNKKFAERLIDGGYAIPSDVVEQPPVKVTRTTPPKPPKPKKPTASKKETKPDEATNEKPESSEE